MKQSRSILEELNALSVERDQHKQIESRAEHLIASAVNLLEQIEKTYSEESARDLSSRLINSIRAKDASKFTRGIKRVVKEHKLESK
jgi:hypothetical protein